MTRNTFNLFFALASVVALIYLLSPMLAPFLVAAILAYMANPLVTQLDRFEYKGKSLNRALSTFFIMLLLITLLCLMVLIIVPIFQKETLLLVQKFPTYLERLKLFLEPRLLHYFGVNLAFDTQQVQQVLTAHWQTASNVAATIAKALSTHSMTIVAWLANALLIPIVLYYLLLDWHKLMQELQRLLPRRIETNVVEIARDIDAVLGEFLRGQLSVMVLMSLFYAIGLWLAGLELAAPIGLLSGLLGFVPYVGIGIGFVFALMSTLLEHGSLLHIMPVLAVYGIGQLLESMVLTPWLVGDRIGLHPLAVIFALMAGGELFGFTGILLALPVSAAIAVAFRHARSHYLNSDFYHQR